MEKFTIKICASSQKAFKIMPLHEKMFISLLKFNYGTRIFLQGESFQGEFQSCIFIIDN
ncbi:Uncharacterised protein [Salmonella enterica subsp. enterica]|uniref:Uncharacterized protein n=1 Tax=Salmonella enterica I TaxID=59201 RepID=A0A3S4HUG5_SALET|nr:Uncharacterised protein [Salmonella enterica subsp. enterica]